MRGSHEGIRMIFENWYKKIRRYREEFIEYYVSQFDEEKRDLITEKFDSLKFCFYIDPNYIKLWVRLQLKEEYKIATYNFFKDFGNKLGIDISKLSLEFNERFGYISIDSDDKSIEERLRNIFTGSVIAIGGMSDDHRFHDLYSFRKLEDFINGEGKHYENPEKELLQRRLIFLKDMGDITIEGRPIDYFETAECKNFVNSSRYKELIIKYCDLAEKASEYKNAVDSKYNNLLEYMEKSLQVEAQIIKKYEKLKQEEKDQDKIKEYDRACKREIVTLRIVCGNYELSNPLKEKTAFDCIIDSGDVQTTVVSCNEKEEQERCIFFCPFKSVPGYEDVDLRHEIRHGITTNVIIEGNTTTYKIGNKIERFVDNDCIETNLADWNEWITQMEAKRETQDAFSRDIYIISKPSIRNQKNIGQTSDYDNYLSSFEIIYNALPASVKQSQIELSNASLYSVIPLTQLQDIEKMIHEGYRWDNELEDKLYIIANQLTGDTSSYDSTPNSK